MSTIDELIAKAKKVAAQADTLVTELERFRTHQSKSGAKHLKHPDGRLTDEGLRVLHEALEDEKSPSEIARVLDISVPAVLYRQNQWKLRRRKGGR